ncbi:MAG: hypothetical protein JST30_06585 [Armatimonadetes bacterium]|nr:hypothetical protein [Armatimonadota bacterium]
MTGIGEEPQSEAIPLRSRADTRNMAVLTAVLTLVAVAIGVATLPYDLRRPSPVLEKAEIRESIRSFRSAHGTWPKTQQDAGFAFGTRALADPDSPTFELQRTAMERPTKNEPPVEAAYYSLRVRGDGHMHRIGLEKPKKRR